MKKRDNSLSLPFSVFPCGVQGEMYVSIVIGTTPLKALIDTGSGGLLTIQNVPGSPGPTYKRRPQVATITTGNIPLGLECSLQCTADNNSACFFSQDSSTSCALQFGTGSVNYNPVLEAIQFGSLTHPAFYIALADTEQDFPFPIPCIMGVSHYKYADNSPLGSLCKKTVPGRILINQATTMFQIFQHLGGGNCLVDTQTLRMAYGPRDKTVSFAVPPPPTTTVLPVPLVSSMFPFYAVELTAFQVGALSIRLPTKQVLILDSGTSSGGSLAPVLYDALLHNVGRYTNGLTGLAINGGTVQGVPANKLGLFPPVSFTWGSYTHVLQPDVYMVPQTCDDKEHFINIFSRGDSDSGNVSIVGNMVFQNLVFTFDLLHDVVYTESSLPVMPTIDVTYPSPARDKLPLTMTESISRGESVTLPAPKVRLGVPHAVFKKINFTVDSSSTEGGQLSYKAALTNNQCCVYNETTQKIVNLHTFEDNNNNNTAANAANAAGGTTSPPPSTTTVWTARNITLLTLTGILLSLCVWRLIVLFKFKKGKAV